MNLARLWLDVRAPAARRDLANAYEMHRTLSRAFAASEAAAPSRFLWRLETDGGRWGAPVVLVQSSRAGHWEALGEGQRYLARGPECRHVDVERVHPAGARRRFRLCANPVRSPRATGRREGITDEAAQLEWLNRQGRQFGFEVETALVTASTTLMLHRGRGASTSAPITIRQIQFDGWLVVRDAAATAAALVDGIGPAKAFGCGMLSLAGGGSSGAGNA